MILYMVIHNGALYVQETLSKGPGQRVFTLTTRKPTSAGDDTMDTVCVTKGGDEVKVVNCPILPAGMVKYQTSMDLSYDAWYALRCYGIKSALVGLRMQVDSNSQKGMDIVLGLVHQEMMRATRTAREARR
jgi:hypothetical protein